MKKRPVLSEQEQLLHAIQIIQDQLVQAQTGFANAVEEDLIDSYSYEILALHKKYAYCLKRAKALGLAAKHSMHLC